MKGWKQKKEGGREIVSFVETLVSSLLPLPRADKLSQRARQHSSTDRPPYRKPVSTLIDIFLQREPKLTSFLPSAETLTRSPAASFSALSSSPFTTIRRLDRPMDSVGRAKSCIRKRGKGRRMGGEKEGGCKRARTRS